MAKGSSADFIIIGNASRFLDAKDSTSLEYKLDTFSSVYRRLTGKDVVFEFPVQAAQE
jgi:small subunit ribosomal protein S7e